MARRSSARWLAPLALGGSVAAVLLVVSVSGGPDGTGPPGAATAVTGSTGATATGAPAPATVATTTSPRPGRRTYVVRAGDTLSRIAARAGVPLAVVERLNPNVDAQTLQAGQRIKLRP